MDNETKTIPKGYKQTEVGVIPEDWDVKTIHDIADVIGGGTPSTQVLDFWNGEINWFTPTEVGEKKYISDSERKITRKGFAASSAKLLPEGTVLLTTRAGIGDVGILVNKGCTNQGFQSLIARPEVNNEYVYYLASTLKNLLVQNSSGSTFLEISPSRVKQIKIAVPEYKEQTTIASALSDVDNIIEKLKKLIAKKKAVKQGVMQELLTGKRRLPGFSGEWEEKKLGEICNYQNGTSLEKYFNKQEGYSVISIGNYSVDGKYIDNKTYINRQHLVDVQRFVLRKGDLTMILNDKTSTGEIIGKVLLIEEDNRYVFNQRTMRLTVKDEIDSLYLSILINSDIIHKEIIGLAKPGTQIYVNTKDITDLLIRYPRLKEEQISIARALSDIDFEIGKLELRLEKYKHIKIGMMQQLLTGKIRIYDKQKP